MTVTRTRARTRPTTRSESSMRAMSQPSPKRKPTTTKRLPKPRLPLPRSLSLISTSTCQNQTPTTLCRLLLSRQQTPNNAPCLRLPNPLQTHQQRRHHSCHRPPFQPPTPNNAQITLPLLCHHLHDQTAQTSACLPSQPDNLLSPPPLKPAHRPHASTLPNPPPAK